MGERGKGMAQAAITAQTQRTKHAASECGRGSAPLLQSRRMGKRFRAVSFARLKADAVRDADK
jgi:hypothetical protein